MRKFGTNLITLLMFLMLFISMTAFSASAEGEARVFDEANLFTTAEIEQMEAKIASLRETWKMDVVIVTTDDAGGKTSQAYADDYYDYNGFGYGNDHRGILLLIDMDNRTSWMSTSGKAVRFFTDDRIGYIEDAYYSYLVSGDYGDAALKFLDEASYYLTMGIPGDQYNYDTETGKISRYRSVSGSQIAVCAVIAVAAGAIFFFVIVSKYTLRFKKNKYTANTNLAITAQNDQFVNQTVTSRRIDTSSSSGGGGGFGGGGGGRSSTHTSSSGRSHGGGGGRKF